MAIESGFFNARLEGNEYDRVYNAEQFADYFSSFIGNGVYGKIMNEFMVVQNEEPNMSVNVRSGKAWVNGWWCKNTSNYNMSIDVADGVLNRIDVIVIRWGNSERDMWLEVIKGTPATNPVAPSILRTVDYYDLKLCEISVPAGAINIKQTQITDTRALTEVCGFVTGVVDQIDTTGMYLQFEAQILEWFDHMKGQLSDDAAINLQNEIDDILATLSAIPASNVSFDNTDTPYESDNVEGALKEVGSLLPERSAIISTDGTKTYLDVFRELFNEIDYSKIRPESKLLIGSLSSGNYSIIKVYRCVQCGNGYLSFERTSTSTTSSPIIEFETLYTLKRTSSLDIAYTWAELMVQSGRIGQVIIESRTSLKPAWDQKFCIEY